jgi:H+-translocating NAD(P) transhydrogenase subunit beta
MSSLIQASYFFAALLFILGLRRMSSPVTARGGVIWAGWGMVLAVAISVFQPNIPGVKLLNNIDLILSAIILGSVIAWVTAKRVAMTDMPQMIALYNGMGGGAAAAIAALALMDVGAHDTAHTTLAILGGLIGAISFSGSLIAFAKLQGILKSATRFALQQQVNLGVFLGSVVLGLMIIVNQGADNTLWLVLMFALALSFGVLVTLPIGGADMPVVISLFNAFTGLAVGFEGYVLGNISMMIAGTVVGSAGTLLTQLMAKAMNRSITNVLFSNFGETAGGEGAEVEGSMKASDPADASIMMAYSENVVIIPGYGMAVAQAQHKVWELSQKLIDRGVKVKFAIHPVAGRMPGHMNVLLAEAGVPYDIIYDLEDINNDFTNTDVVLVIGANDVVNPIAETDPSSPIYGMPILSAYKAKNVLVIKRGQGKGFSGIENHLFYRDNTKMVYGDGQAVVADLIQSLKGI